MSAVRVDLWDGKRIIGTTHLPTSAFTVNERLEVRATEPFEITVTKNPKGPIFLLAAGLKTWIGVDRAEKGSRVVIRNLGTRNE